MINCSQDGFSEVLSNFLLSQSDQDMDAHRFEIWWLRPKVKLKSMSNLEEIQNWIKLN